MKRISLILLTTLTILVFYGCSANSPFESEPNKAVIGASMYGYVSNIIAEQQVLNNMIMYVSREMDFQDSTSTNTHPNANNSSITFGKNTIKARFNNCRYFGILDLLITHDGTSLTDTTNTQSVWNVRVNHIKPTSVYNWIESCYYVQVTRDNHFGEDTYSFVIDTIANGELFYFDSQYTNANPTNLNECPEYELHCNIPAYRVKDDVVRLTIENIFIIESTDINSRPFYASGAWNMLAYNSKTAKAITADFYTKDATSNSSINYYVSFNYDGESYEVRQRGNDNDNYDKFYYTGY